MSSGLLRCNEYACVAVVCCILLQLPRQQEQIPVLDTLKVGGHIKHFSCASQSWFVLIQQYSHVPIVLFKGKPTEQYAVTNKKIHQRTSTSKTISQHSYPADLCR